MLAKTPISIEYSGINQLSIWFPYVFLGLPQGVNRGKGGQKQVMTGAGAGEGEGSSDCADDEASL